MIRSGIRDLIKAQSIKLHSYMQIISLSASTNKLSKIQERADEYAALIMEELDPDGLGFVEVTYN